MEPPPPGRKRHPAQADIRAALGTSDAATQQSQDRPQAQQHEVRSLCPHVSFRYQNINLLSSHFQGQPVQGFRSQLSEHLAPPSQVPGVYGSQVSHSVLASLADSFN